MAGQPSAVYWEQRFFLHMMFAGDRALDFKKARQLASFCINWDPGSYSGLSWSVGLIYSHESKVASILPPKVVRLENQ